MADDSSHDELISDFVGVTGASAADAAQYLEANEWNPDTAATLYLAAQDEPAPSDPDYMQSEPQEPEEEPYTGPRTLDGRPAPQSIPSVASSSRAPPKKRGGIATLGSLGQSSGPPGGHGHAHDDDSDDEDFHPAEEPRDLFAGGEKSGLAVQDPARNDPRKVVKDILNKARANAERPGGEPSSSAPPSRFRGGGQTLGGDDAPSQVIPDPHPQTAAQGPPQTRVLHLWQDGFSIEDGALRRFDDSQHAADLQMIRTGRAPLHLMNVVPGQPVDVQLITHDENYKPLPKVYKPFSGSGQRLGSPTPGGPTVTSTPAPAAAPAAAASSSSSIVEQEVDSSQPTLSLRLQLASGQRLPARFNTTHTIGDVYDFINRANSGSSDRPWVLATTFPNKDHTDKSLALGDVAEFKRGGTAVQKWA